MSYATKYISTFGTLSGDVVTVELQQPDYVGTATNIRLSIDRPVSIETRSTGFNLFGVFPTVCKIRLVNDSTLDLSEFVVEQQGSWLCVVSSTDRGVIFKGFIVVDDLSAEFRADPVQVELTFTDGLGLLSAKEAVIQISAGQENVMEIVAKQFENLMPTVDTQQLVYHDVYFSIKPEGNEDNGLVDVYAMARTWAKKPMNLKRPKS